VEGVFEYDDDDDEDDDDDNEEEAEEDDEEDDLPLTAFSIRTFCAMGWSSCVSNNPFVNEEE